MKKIYLDVKVSVAILADDDIDMSNIMDNLDTQVTSDSDKFDVEVIDISEPNITDVK
jgi:hypothetical protein